MQVSVAITDGGGSGGHGRHSILATQRSSRGRNEIFRQICSYRDPAARSGTTRRRGQTVTKPQVTPVASRLARTTTAPVAAGRDDRPVRAGDYRTDGGIARTKRGPSLPQRRLPGHRDRRQQVLATLVIGHRAIFPLLRGCGTRLRPRCCWRGSTDAPRRCSSRRAPPMGGTSGRLIHWRWAAPIRQGTSTRRRGNLIEHPLARYFVANSASSVTTSPEELANVLESRFAID